MVLAGGHAAFNPEPIADFIDAAVLGDGEQAVLAITDMIREWKRGAARRPRRAADCGWPQRRRVRPAFLRRDYRPDGRSAGGAEPAGRAARGRQAHRHGPGRLAVPGKPLVPVAETVHERFSVEIFRGCTRGCRFCQAGMITRPVRERSITTIGEMVENGLAASGFKEVGLLSLSSADHSEINEIATGLADRYEGTNTGLSLPSTRVDAFNVTLANELSRNGRRSGLTFAPEGGTERMRKVINKMVTEDDLIRTVATAYANGWRQVKLYFMCGLPTETDEDVLAIARVARRVIEAGRRRAAGATSAARSRSAAFVPKPHTPFQWAGQCDHETVDARLRALGRAARRPGVRQVDRLPLPRRQAVDGRGPAVARRPPGRQGDPGGLAGRRQVRRLERVLLLRALGTVRRRGAGSRRRRPGLVHHPGARLRRGAALGPPGRRAGPGLAVAGLAGGDRPGGAAEVEDCRWTPCFECGVCPAMGTEIQTGPTGANCCR